MIHRFVHDIAFSPRFGRQMRWIAGPRQTGKTTLVQDWLNKNGYSTLYYNWDQRKTRERYKNSPYFFHSDALPLVHPEKKWICFDEIHKYPKWKNILKDYFDEYHSVYQFIITGSARLDLFKKSGDPLTGRYFTFRLFPVSLAEFTRTQLDVPKGNQSAANWLEGRFQQEERQKELDHLLHFGGFPEPLLRGDDVFGSNWRSEYVQTFVREDLRDLTKIQELENVATLLSLLPPRIGSPLSLNALKEDMHVSYNAVRNYYRALVLIYALFEVSPYSKRIARSLKKEKKIYFYDWTLPASESTQFENYVACEIQNWISLWSISTPEKYDVFYVRTHDKRETDFLITQNNKPYLLIETKLQPEPIASHHYSHANQLGGIPLIQIVKQKGVASVARKGHGYMLSASRFF